jgi:ParB-like chromosome segregation protein Spo0J
MSKITFVGQQEVPIDELKPHPDNPNRGSVNDLANSLEEFGQFRSIVATKDMVILAGHHLVEAAKSKGIETIRADILDVDEKTARKIMLADNRLADLGLGPNLDLLLQNLEALGNDLEGTGFDEDYLRMLEEAVAGPPDLDELEAEINETPASPEDFYRRITLMIEPALATQWEAVRKLYPDDNTAFGSILDARQPQ